jgi:hypothetical protein
MTMTDEKDKKNGSSSKDEEKKIEGVRDTGAHTPDSKRTSSNPPKAAAKEPEKDDEEEEEEEEKPAPKKASAAKKDEKKEEKKPAKKEEKKAPPPKPWVNFFPPRELPKHGPEIVTEKKPALMLAEFDSPGRCLHAAERLRDAGYTKFDAHSPFPIHGMDAAMGMPDSKLGWIVLTGGLTGLTTAVVMIYWMNGIDYPLIIGGKPPFSLPPSVPIMFELTILFSAFSALFGMLHLNRLPRHHHPIFESERFTECSDDKFFLSVEVDDPKYGVDRTRALLEKLHPTHVEVVEETIETIVSHDEDEDH